jgi:hypothetical protein
MSVRKVMGEGVLDHDFHVVSETLCPQNRAC